MIYDETFTPNRGAIVQWNGNTGLLQNSKKYRVIDIRKDNRKFTRFTLETFKNDKITGVDLKPVWFFAGEPFEFIRKE
jgi:hypothetical protein